MTQHLKIPNDIKALTSLRFFAAIAVVIFHFAHNENIDLSAYTYLFNKGYLAVDFFFILSGFIMAHVYGASIIEKRFSFISYMKKRFARLYPMHIVTLLLFVLLGLAFHVLDMTPNKPEKYDWGAIPANLLMVHAWGFVGNNTFNTPSWSISAEWFAYILFLPLSLLILKSRSKPLIAYILSLALFTALYVIVPASPFTDRPLTGLSYDFGIIRIFPEFIAGIATYFLCKQTVISKKSSLILTYTTLAIVLVLLHIGADDLLIVLLFTALLFGYTSRARYTQNGFVDHPVCVFLGHISYALYMTHALFYTVFFNGIDILIKGDVSPTLDMAIWVFGIIATVPLAAIFYLVIEEPGRKFLNKRLANLFVKKQAAI